MQRKYQISVPAEATDRLVAELTALDAVVGLSLSRGAALKPPGDLLHVQVLNRGTDEVLRRVAAAAGAGASVATSELAAIASPSSQATIERDVDDAVWEE